MIPDGITPKSAWRAWRLQGNRITSSNQGVAWEPGVPIKAFCSQLGQSEQIEVNILEAGKAEIIRNHMAQNFSPPIYEVDEGENRVYFTKKSYLFIPRAVPVALRVPSVRCSCGIYATTNINEAQQYGPIIGRVALWGYVITHQTGYRAQYAYPQSFYVPDHELGEYKDLLAEYRVPIYGLSEILPRRSKSEAQEATVYPTLHTEVQDDDEEEDPDPTLGDGVRRLRMSDLRKAYHKLMGR